MGYGPVGNGKQKPITPFEGSWAATVNRVARNNPCTLCGKPGIPGLFSGGGKCQYHWNIGVWEDARGANP